MAVPVCFCQMIMKQRERGTRDCTLLYSIWQSEKIHTCMLIAEMKWNVNRCELTKRSVYVVFILCMRLLNTIWVWLTHKNKKLFISASESFERSENGFCNGSSSSFGESWPPQSGKSQHFIPIFPRISRNLRFDKYTLDTSGEWEMWWLHNVSCPFKTTRVVL